METAGLCTSCRYAILQRYLRIIRCFRERRAPHHTRRPSPRIVFDGLASPIAGNVSTLHRSTAPKQPKLPIRNATPPFSHDVDPSDGYSLLGYRKLPRSTPDCSQLLSLLPKDACFSRSLHLSSLAQNPSDRNPQSEPSSKKKSHLVRRIMATKPSRVLGRLENIFEDITTQFQTVPDLEPGLSSRNSATNEGPKMAERYVSATTSYSSWDHLESLIDENPASADLVTSRTWDKATLDFTRQWCSDTIQTTTDTPRTVIQSAIRYSKRLDLVHFSLWHLTAHAAAKLQEFEDSRVTGQTLNSSGRAFSETVNELLSIWEMILKLGKYRQHHPGVGKSASALSMNEKKTQRLFGYGYVSHVDNIGYALRTLGAQSTFRQRFRYFYPALPDNQMGTVPEAAVTSFLMFRKIVFSPDVFSNLWAEPTEGPKKLTHFVNFITRLLPPASDGDAQLRLRKDVDHAFKPHAYDERHVQYVIALLETLSDSVERDSILVEFSHALNSIVARRDNAKLDHVWEQIKRRVLETKLPGRPIQHNKIFSHVMSTAFNTNRQGKAVEIWNFMMQNDTMPNVHHWTTMIRGFGELRDHRAVEELWERMKDSGVQSDAHVWATRIWALGKSRRVDLALQAFRSMIAIWLEEVKKQETIKTEGELAAMGDVNGCPKPDIVCLNALITSLTENRTSPFDEITELLSYAKVLGIHADAFTFNPLVVVAARQDDMDLARELVEQMQSQGIQPDSITYSILLRYAFEALPASESDKANSQIDLNIPSSPPLSSGPEPSSTSLADPASSADAQRDMLDSAHASAASLVSTTSLETATEILDRMHAANIPRHTHVYQTLITGLLRGSTFSSSFASTDNGLRAAFAVVQYMFEHAIPRNDIIYAQFVTALLPSSSSYTRQKHPAGSRLAPVASQSSLAPDFASLQRLWRIALNDSSTPLRTYFWSILVARLADFDALDLANTAIAQATERSQVLNWEACLALLRALHRVHDYDAAAQLVRRVRTEQAMFKGEVQGLKFRREFWMLAKSLNLPTDFEDLEGETDEQGEDMSTAEILKDVGTPARRVSPQKPGEKTWDSAKGFGGEMTAAPTD